MKRIPWYTALAGIGGLAAALTASADVNFVSHGSKTVTPQAEAGLPPGLVNYQQAVRSHPALLAYYTFEESDAADATGNFPGTLVGTTAFESGIGGGPDKALLLTGDGHVTFGEVLEFDFLTAVGTIEGWIRADWDAGSGYNPAIWADRDGGPVNWSIHMRRRDKASIMHWNGSSVAQIAIPPQESNDTTWP